MRLTYYKYFLKYFIEVRLETNGFIIVWIIFSTFSMDTNYPSKFHIVWMNTLLYCLLEIGVICKDFKAHCAILLPIESGPGAFLSSMSSLQTALRLKELLILVGKYSLYLMPMSGSRVFSVSPTVQKCLFSSSDMAFLSVTVAPLIVNSEFGLFLGFMIRLRDFEIA